VIDWLDMVSLLLSLTLEAGFSGYLLGHLTTPTGTVMSSHSKCIEMNIELVPPMCVLSCFQRLAFQISHLSFIVVIGCCLERKLPV